MHDRVYRCPLSTQIHSVRVQRGWFLYSGTAYRGSEERDGDDLTERYFVILWLIEGHAHSLHGLGRSHCVALDRGKLHETANGVAGYAAVMLHGDFGCIFDLSIVAAES